MAEHRTVDARVVGSTPISRPKDHETSSLLKQATLEVFLYLFLIQDFRRK
jgi:hypothetical protein